MWASVDNSKDDEVAGVHPKIDPEGKSTHNRDGCHRETKGNARGFDPIRRMASSIASGEPLAKSRLLLFVPSRARRGLLPRLAAERRPDRSRPVGKLAPHVARGNRGSRIGLVLCATAIEFGAQLRPELQFGITLRVRQTFPRG
jgi:hypothetical protein